MSLYYTGGDVHDASREPSTVQLFLARLFRSTLSRLVTAFLVILALYIAYGRHRFYRDPVSIFFSEQHGYDRFYSAHREHEATAFGSRFSAELTADPFANVPPKAGDAPLICASLVSVARPGLDRQYLETSLASLIANLTVQERELIHIKVFFADPNPGAHAQYGSTTVQALADDMFAYRTDLPLDDLSHITALAARSPSKSAVEKKAMFDYSRAMQRCLNTTGAPYIAIFEDDVLFADGWLANTLAALNEAKEMMQQPSREAPREFEIEPGQPNDFLYLRLFNQERSTGWAGGAGFFANNVPYISSAIGLPVLVILTCVRLAFRRSRFARGIDLPVLAFIVLVAIPASVWLFFASGKASLLPPPAPGVYEEVSGCCSQALVYPRAPAAAFAPWLVAQAERQGGGRGNSLARQFAFERGLARLSAYPMVVQHVGSRAGSGTADTEAKRVWSMAFEDLDAVRLAEQHAALAGELFPDAGIEYIT